MKKFIEEFKAFALKGNVMDMAVGVIIGGAFSGIVTSLTDNFINPILNVLTGGATYSMTDIAGFASNFLSAVVNFFIMAFILSARVRSALRLHAVHTVLLFWKKSKKNNRFRYLKKGLSH